MVERGPEKAGVGGSIPSLGISLTIGSDPRKWRAVVDRPYSSTLNEPVELRVSRVA